MPKHINYARVSLNESIINSKNLSKSQTNIQSTIRNIGIHLSCQAVPFSPNLLVQVEVWVEIGQDELLLVHLVVNPET
jgi:hypothetical protein